MELLFKLLMAILVISIILILLDRSVFTFIEENLPYINEIEKQHKNESKKEGMTSVEEEQRQMDEQQN